MNIEDQEIIRLYWERDQQALRATAEQYGGYCLSIARNILGNSQDAEECVNDAYLKAWNAIPPHRPEVLSAFLGKITRNLCFNRYQRLRAEKRGGGQTNLVLEELADCLSGGVDVEEQLDRRELLQAVNCFLAELPREKRAMFVCRYWYADSVGEIASRFGRTENQVSVTLHRIRRKLKSDLEERGFAL